MRFLALSLFILVFILPFAAKAACPNPNEPSGVSVEGTQVYNFDYKVMQYCDGTTWWSMKTGGASVLKSLSDVNVSSPADNDVLTYDSTTGKWVAGSGGGGADNLGNHTATQALNMGTFNITNAGNVTATAYFHSSDARLKMDIEAINGLETLKNLHGVRYRWNKDGQAAAGILAQDVEAVMPYAVIEDSNGMKAVDYDQLIAPLIEAVKAQQVQIEAMQRKIDALGG